MASTRTPAPLFPVVVPPDHLAHLLGQGVLFLHDADGAPIASIDLEVRGGNLVPREHSLEVHSSDAPWSRIRRTRVFGRCVSCYDERGQQVAVVVVEEAPLE